MMRIIPLDKKHIPQARQWINRLIEGEGLVYKPLEEALKAYSGEACLRQGGIRRCWKQKKGESPA